MWAINDYRIFLKERRTSVGSLYNWNAPFLKIRTFLYMCGQIASYFEFAAPDIAEYLNSRWYKARYFVVAAASSFVD